MKRLFIAIPLPEPVHLTLEGLQGGLPAARRVPVGNFHLTLRFLGELDKGSFEDIDAALSMISPEPFSLDLEGCGIFGTEKRPSSLWVGVAPGPALHHLQQKIDNAMHRIGLGHDSRKYFPHVTLARFGASNRGRLSQFIQGNNLFRYPDIPVTAFSLFSSKLGHTGPTYTEEARYPLGEDLTPDWMAEESALWEEDPGIGEEEPWPFPAHTFPPPVFPSREDDRDGLTYPHLSL